MLGRGKTGRRGELTVVLGDWKLKGEDEEEESLKLLVEGVAQSPEEG